LKKNAHRRRAKSTTTYATKVARQTGASARMQELPDALEHLGDGQTEDDRQQD